MKNSEKFERAFEYFKRDYAYKMGGTQIVILPNGKSKFFDDREYYTGAGAKYNRSIKHDDIGEVCVSGKDYSLFLKELKEMEMRWEKQALERSEKETRIKEALKMGKYSIVNNYVELSEEESSSRRFNPILLANTLGISVQDASLLNSEGKTYVFAKSTDGNIYQLYHPSLDCNDLSIHVEVATPERIAEFDHAEWFSAPYALEVGMTENNNHFVC